MKKNIFGLIAFLIIAVAITFNVKLSLNSKSNLDITLSEVEASASWWEDLQEWWDSKVYKCVERDCTKSYTILFWSTSYSGKYNNCVSGDEYAHCSGCETGCDAY